MAAAAFATVAMTTNIACTEDENVAVKGIIPDAVEEVFPDAGVDIQVDVEQIYPDAGVDIQPDVPEIEIEEVSPPDAGVSPDVVDVMEWDISAGVDIGEPEPPTEVMEIDGEGPQVGGITPEIDEE